MKNRVLDQFGYLNREQFIALHEALVKLLKKKYIDLDLETFYERECKSKKQDGEITKLSSWLYKPNKKQEKLSRELDRELPDLDAVCKDHALVQRFLKDYRRIRNRDGEDFNMDRISFKLQLYNMKRAFFPPDKTEGEKFYRINKPYYLYGFSFSLYPEKTSLAAAYKKIEEAPLWVADPHNALSDTSAGMPDVSSEKDWNYYLGSYFSVKEFRIKNIILSLRLDIEQDRFEAREWGFHNIEDEYEDEEWEYYGEGNFNNGFLFVNLLSKRDGNRLNIIGAVNKRKKIVKQQRLFRASIQGVSRGGDNRMIMAEVVFLKIDKDHVSSFTKERRDPVSLNILSSLDYSTLSFYLVLHRYMMGIQYKQIGKINDLKAKDSIVSNFQYLIGTYRIWNFGLSENGRIVQSKFQIKADGTATLRPFVQLDRGSNTEKAFKQKIQEQPCVINISDNFSTPKIWVVTFAKPGLSITNVALFDYPETKEDKVIEGTFASIGYDKGGIISGYTVMIRDEREFDVDEMTIDQAIAYAKEHELKPLLKILFELYKKKSWPQGSGRAHFFELVNFLRNT